jgi:hypothetical protein
VRASYFGLLVVEVFFVLASGAAACSISTSSNFTEVASSFTVVVEFEGKPLPDVDVALYLLNGEQPFISTKTARSGIARVSELPPGKYRLQTRHLGVYASVDQIEVMAPVSRLAKSRLNYRWGEAPIVVSDITGTFVEFRRQGATPFERLKNPPIVTPVGGVQIQLHHPTNGSIYSDVSDTQGQFAFVGVPSDIYVMNVREQNDAANFLIRMAPTGTKGFLQLSKGETSCGVAYTLSQPDGRLYMSFVFNSIN